MGRENLGFFRNMFSAMGGELLRQLRQAPIAFLDTRDQFLDTRGGLLDTRGRFLDTKSGLRAPGLGNL